MRNITLPSLSPPLHVSIPLPSQRSNSLDPVAEGERYPPPPLSHQGSGSGGASPVLGLTSSLVSPASSPSHQGWGGRERDHEHASYNEEHDSDKRGQDLPPPAPLPPLPTTVVKTTSITSSSTSLYGGASDLSRGRSLSATSASTSLHPPGNGLPGERLSSKERYRDRALSQRSTQSNSSGVGSALASEKTPYNRGGGSSGLVLPPHLTVPSHPYLGGGVASASGTPTATNVSAISLGGNSSVGNTSSGGLTSGQGLDPSTPMGMGVPNNGNGPTSMSLAVEHHVVLTPLDFIPGGRVKRYLGPVQLHFMKDSWSIRGEAGGSLESFYYRFISEVNASARAHVAALGGNALLCHAIVPQESGEHKNGVGVWSSVSLVLFHQVVQQ